MFTGRWPDELSADWEKPLDARYPTLAEVLRDKGYLTAGFAANIFFCTTELGLARGFLHFEDYPVSPSQMIVSSSIGRELISFSLNRDSSFRVRQWIGYNQIPGRKNAAQVNDGFLGWLSQQDGKRPFFAFLNYLDAHQPFLPPSPFDSEFLGRLPRGDVRHWWGRNWSPQEIQAEAASYDGAIAYIDQQLDLLFGELKRRGELDRTVVIVTSDHGEHLGEHGFMRHGNTLYSEVLQVPLLIRFPPAIPAGVRVPEPVSLRDLPATVLGLLDVTCEGCLPGRTLSALWMNPGGTAGGAPTSPIFSEVRRGIRIPERYPNAKADLKSLIAGQLHYIVRSDGIEELYDLSVDPHEADNLAGSAGRAADLARLRGQLGSAR
jgi:arylsulfatase A-like enzyme